jgi:hypothetical protein
MQAKYPVKVQAIRSKGRTDRFYVFIPLPLAAAIGLEAGEEFQWFLENRNVLSVHRVSPVAGRLAVNGIKKKAKRDRS